MKFTRPLKCQALSSTYVVPSKALFSTGGMSLVVPISLKCFSKLFGTVPKAPIMTGITFVLVCHNFCTSILKHWYLSTLSCFLRAMFWSSGITLPLVETNNVLLQSIFDNFKKTFFNLYGHLKKEFTKTEFVTVITLKELTRLRVGLSHLREQNFKHRFHGTLNCGKDIETSSLYLFRSSHPEVLLGRDVLKICSKFTGEHPNRSAALQLYWNCTSAWVFSCKFATYFQTPFLKNTSGWLLLSISLLRLFTRK